MDNDFQTLLNSEPVVINIGVQSFAESLLEQEVPVVQVDWTPPANRDKDMDDLLAKLL